MQKKHAWKKWEWNVSFVFNPVWHSKVNKKILNVFSYMLEKLLKFLPPISNVSSYYLFTSIFLIEKPSSMKENWIFYFVYIRKINLKKGFRNHIFYLGQRWENHAHTQKKKSNNKDFYELELKTLFRKIETSKE